jgi:hypothetical protein
VWSRLRGLLGGSSKAPTDMAERLTKPGLFRVAQESASLSDRKTVQRWVRELSAERDEQVLVHRPWGTVAAVADGRNPIGVVLSDGEHSWFAVPPGAVDAKDLTLEQVEHIVLDALTASEQPAWPEWRAMI